MPTQWASRSLPSTLLQARRCTNSCTRTFPDASSDDSTGDDAFSAPFDASGYTFPHTGDYAVSDTFAIRHTLLDL